MKLISPDSSSAKKHKQQEQSICAPTKCYVMSDIFKMNMTINMQLDRHYRVHGRAFILRKSMLLQLKLNVEQVWTCSPALSNEAGSNGTRTTESQK